MRKRNIRKKRKQYKLFVLFGLLFTLLLSVGYAAFQSTLSINVNGKIKKYLVTFDANGGTTPTQSKYVGANYGKLPTPIRDGYTFKGWHGKNLLNINVDESFPSSVVFSNSTQRTFTPNTYVLGLAFNNYYNFYDLIKTDFSINNNQIFFKTRSAYGVGFPIRSTEYQNYVLSYNISSTNRAVSSALFYKEDGTFIDKVSIFYNGKWQISFITPKDTYYLVIVFGSNNEGVASSVTVSDVQLKIGNSVTAYEPYFITDNSNVVQKNNHTLTAIWEENN